MKRVALTTLYEAENYGTCLQAFALYKSIEKLGYDCSIVKFNRFKAAPKKSTVKKVLSLGILESADIYLSREIIKEQKKRFEEFRNRNFKYTERSYDSLQQVSQENWNYDAYITGSDMVWSWESKDYLDYFFLKYAPKGKRISYAPSFGNANFTLYFSSPIL